MKEIPILFSGPMIRAIRRDVSPKTQTRRVMRPQPPSEPIACEWFHPTIVDRHGEEQPGPRTFGAHGEEWSQRCPYGAPGDRLYVREAWRAGHHWDEREGAPPAPEPFAGRPAPNTMIHYEADGPAPDWAGRYRHARFMPRWASRVDLSIVSIRVERVQDISDADIAAEGVDAEAVEALWNAATRKRRREVNEAFGYGPDHAGAVVGSSTRPRDLWRIAWTLINGAKSWDENGFVWAIQFARVGGR